MPVECLQKTWESLSSRQPFFNGPAKGHLVRFDNLNRAR